MFDSQQPNYQGLRAVITERTNQVVFWIGSGLSSDSGMPSWKGLRDSVCEYFRRHLSSISDGSSDGAIREVDYIQKESDLWVAFERAHGLGRVTYEESIRKAFSESVSCKIPEAYNILFTIDIKGIITLNIDRLSTRAFTANNPGASPVEFCGNQCAEYAHILKTRNKFILNAHGVIESAGSWILRNDQRKWLLQDPAYLTFVQSVLLNYTVVFVAVSVDDLAVSAHLERLRAAGISMRGQYWITDRSDIRTNQWAEENGLSLIRYNPASNHQQLAEMLRDLRTYCPSDPERIDPVTRKSAQPVPISLRMPDLMLRDDEELVRQELNAYAKYILRDENQNRYDEYEQFRCMYDKCIHHCWYVGTVPPYNRLMGYEIVREIAEGAFGRVFEARAPNGHPVALKLLRDEVRRKPDMLQGFRRGVRAMQILSEHHVDGMVGYSDCSEIPAFAVMELIDGPNLGEAVNSGYLDDWDILLRFAIQLGLVIRRAHQLPERVLHRDIRPANIMLSEYYTDPDNSKVVVLDFDLSWHREAVELSVTHGAAMHGYLAPEQTERLSGVSTRNAAVDSFGIGMTLYFMRTKHDPVYLQHRHGSWDSDVKTLICREKCPYWHSLPIRFAELVLSCTKDIQAERCDMTYIVTELERLHTALLSPSCVSYADIVCHELAYRCCENLGQLQMLNWDYDSQSASFQMVSGAAAVLNSDEMRHCVSGVISWGNTGATEFKNVRKYLGMHADRAVSILRKGGFEIVDGPSFTVSETRFSFRAAVGVVAERVELLAKCLAEAIQELRLT